MENENNDQQVQQPAYEEMTFSASQVRAVDILIRGIQVAQKRGSFNLQESSSLNEAFKLIVPGYMDVAAPTEKEAASA